MAKKQALPAAVQDMVKQAAESIVDAVYGEGGTPNRNPVHRGRRCRR